MKLIQPSLSHPGTGIFSFGRQRYCACTRKSCRISIYTALAALLALAVFPACPGENGLTAEINISENESSAVTLSFSADRPVSRLRVLDISGEMVLTQQLPDLRDGEFVLPLGGEEREFVVILQSDPGDFFEKKIKLQGSRASFTGIRSPFQAADETAMPLLMTPASTAPLIFTFDGESFQAEHYRLNIWSDGPLLVSDDGLLWSDKLMMEDPRGERFRNFSLRILPEARPGEYRLTAEIEPLDGDGKNSLSFEKTVVVIDEEALSEQISIESVVMPTSRDGKENGGLRRDHLVLSGGGRREGNGGGAERGLRYPLSFETVLAQNSFEFPVAVVLTSRILDGAGRPVESFQVPPSLPGPLVQVAAVLPAQGRQKVTLPIYGDPNSADPGQYIRKIELVLAGTDVVVDRVEASLTVERPAELALTVTMLAAGLAAVAIGLILLRGNRLHSGFSTRQTVLAGLFAAATVVLVNVPAYFLTSITVVVLGPLGFLVDGLLSEFVFFALLAALVSIVPRPGVCATVTGIRFLLGGILLGMITPVGILYATVSAFSLELALWICRRGIKGGERLPMRSVLLFALANALISWAGFQFAIVFFRLHYAQWYIVLSVLIGGFVYALLGSLVGRRIGAHLARAIP